MYLWKFKETPETREPLDKFPCDMFRWVLETGFTEDWGINLFLTHEHRFRESQEWTPSHTACYGFAFSLDFREWKWGSDHFYYDGPHCVWNFGPLYIQWGGNWKCKKCFSEKS